MSFLVKYKPHKIADIIGQDSAVKALLAYLQNYPREKKRALLLYGPTGSGKTGSVHAIARELDYELVEINASDQRNAQAIHAKVGHALHQQSLFATQKIILIDDIDGMSGSDDRGGVQAVCKLLEDSRYPVVLTALDITDQKLKSLVKICKRVEFMPLDYVSLMTILKKICSAEAITATDDNLKFIAYRSAGDARAAINDLISVVADKKIDTQRLETLGGRDRNESMQTALTKIFKTTDFETALSAFNAIAEDTDEQMLWLDENLPKEYTNPHDLARAYNLLSRANLYAGRIRRRQHYRFLVYISALLTAGIATAKDKKYTHTIDYKETGRILKIWIANQKIAKRKSIAQKIALGIHESQRQTLKATMPYFPIIFKNKEWQHKIIAEFDLSEEEVEWLKKK